MKQFVINLLTQQSSWIGTVLLLTIFFVPRSWLAIFAVILILVDDSWFSSQLVQFRSWLERKWT